MQRVCLSLMTAVLAASVLAGPPRGAKVLVDVAFAAGTSYSIAAPLAQDEAWTYLGTPAGLYRIAAPLGTGSEAELVALEGSEILGVYVHEGALYVLKVAEETAGGPATDRAFLRSIDGGETFTPLDDGLEECYGGYCAYLTASQAAFHGDVIFLNAGGNLLASRGGGPWTPLVGEIAR
jgi:hypothetical protein